MIETILGMIKLFKLDIQMKSAMSDGDKIEISKSENKLFFSIVSSGQTLCENEELGAFLKKHGKK